MHVFVNNGGFGFHFHANVVNPDIRHVNGTVYDKDIFSARKAFIDAADKVSLVDEIVEEVPIQTFKTMQTAEEKRWENKDWLVSQAKKFKIKGWQICNRWNVNTLKNKLKEIIN